MNPRTPLALAIATFLVALQPFFGPPHLAPGSQASDPTSTASAESRLNRLPLRFEPNRGQAASAADYVVRGRGYTALLAPERLSLAFRDARPLHIEFADMSGAPGAEASGLLPGHTHYLRGSNPADWVRHVPGFGRVRYESVYPGIDLVYYGRERRLEYDFVVAPHADPSVIAFTCPGATDMVVEPDGALVLHDGARRFVMHRPLTYQVIEDQRVEVESRYALSDGRVGFELGRFDERYALVIDPVLQYATFFGGNGEDAVLDIAVDEAGNAYITGSTTSNDLHTSTGAFDESGGGFSDPGDVFVAKLDSTGSNLIYGTYLSGVGTEVGYSIAVDAVGNAYVTGTTDSEDDTLTVPDEGFPLKNALQPAYGGDTDLFVTKLNADGSDLVYSTYLGGSQIDRGDTEQDQPAIALGPSGTAYIAGTTQSADFPTTSGAYSTSGPGPFTAKLNTAGSALEYSTFLGGNTFVFVWDVAVDVFGQAHVVGYTGNPNLPTTGGVVQPVKDGVEDQFAYKLAADGDALVYCTYIGGIMDDFAHAIALDDSGNAYMTGLTISSDYPLTSGSVPLSGGAPVTKLNPSASSIEYALMLGGDIGYGIAVDKLGRATVTGDAAATPPDRDVFFSQVNAAGTFTEHETFWGGLFRDIGYGVALDPDGNAYVSGSTNSGSFPGETPSNMSPLQSSIAVVPDGFVVHLDRDSPVTGVTRSAAATTVVSTIITGDAMANRSIAYAPRLRVPAGTTIEDGYAGRFVGTAPSTSWLVWIDRDWWADFAHPTRYVLIDCVSGAVVLQAEGEFWPLLNGVPYVGKPGERAQNNPDIIYVSPSIPAPAPPVAQAPREGFGLRQLITETTPAGTDSWAIVVSGEDTTGNLARRTTVDSALAVFSTGFNIPANQIRFFNNPNRQALLDSINNTPDGCPKLYVFFTGHGRRGRIFSGGDSTSAADLAGALKNQSAGEYCTFWCQCYSGSFLAAFNDSGVAGLHVTSTTADTTSLRYDTGIAGRTTWAGNFFGRYILDALRKGKRGMDAQQCARDSLRSLLDWWVKRGFNHPQDPRNGQVFVFGGPGEFVTISPADSTKSVCIMWNPAAPEECANGSIYCELVPAPGDTTFKLTKFWNWNGGKTRYFNPYGDPAATGEYRFVSHANTHPHSGIIVYRPDSSFSDSSSKNAFPAAALGTPGTDDEFGAFVAPSTAVLQEGLDLATVSGVVGQTPGGNSVLTIQMPLEIDPVRSWLYNGGDPLLGYNGNAFVQIHATTLLDDLGSPVSDLPVRVDFTQGTSTQTFYAEAVEFGGEVFIDPVFLPGITPEPFSVAVNVEEAPALKGVPRSGSFALDAAVVILELSGTVDVPGIGSGVPVARLQLLPPAPNPFRDGALLRFVLPAADMVRLEIFDVTGRRVRTLADRRFTAGRHEVHWDGRGGSGVRLPGGVYFARLATPGEHATRKIARIE